MKGKAIHFAHVLGETIPAKIICNHIIVLFWKFAFAEGLDCGAVVLSLLDHCPTCVWETRQLSILEA